MNAGAYGAKSVTSIDISPKAMDLCEKNWELNGLDPSQHELLTEDIFTVMDEALTGKDIVVVDPPSMAHSESQKVTAMAKYTDLFSQVAKHLSSGADIFFSSCSSHVNFQDFQEIITESLSRSRKMGQLLRVSGQGHDHPVVQVCPEQRYLKFFHVRLK